jgi:nuclear GTP-binding protein
MGKFANKPHAKTSKRQALSKKYKIKSKVRDHKKKIKKEARKMKALGMVKKKTNNEAALPNLYPFKK